RGRPRTRPMVRNGRMGQMRGLISACGFAALILFLTSSAFAVTLSGSGTTSHAPPQADLGPITYALDDGAAADGVGIVDEPTPTYDLIWLNSFTRQTGGELINQIKVAYGSP